MNEMCKYHNDRTVKLEEKIDKMSEVVFRLDEKIKLLTDVIKTPKQSSFIKTKFASTVVDKASVIILCILTSLIMPTCNSQVNSASASDIQISK